MPKPVHHAEHVGSLLRPPELLEAREAFKRGGLSGEALTKLEDDAALAAMQLQRDAGIEVFPDGEVRRAAWMAGLLEPLDGVVPGDRPTSAWFREDGMAPEEETAFEMVAAAGKLAQKRRLTAEE